MHVQILKLGRCKGKFYTSLPPQEYDLNKDGFISYREFEKVSVLRFIIVRTLQLLILVLFLSRQWRPSSDTPSEYSPCYLLEGYRNTFSLCLKKETKLLISPLKTSFV